MSKKSFLTNLVTRVYKPLEQEKSSSRMASRPPLRVASAHVGPPERKLDASLPDEAFLDVDIDAIMSGSPKPKSTDRTVAMSSNTSSTNISTGLTRPMPPAPTTSQYQSHSLQQRPYNPQPQNPPRQQNTTYRPQQPLLPLHAPQSQAHTTCVNDVHAIDEEEDEVAILERAAAKAMAELARARAAKMGSVSSGGSSGGYSGWDDTPSEIQRRATAGVTSHSFNNAAVPGRFERSNESYGSSATGHHPFGSASSGAMDYNGNVDHSNIPNSLVMDSGSSYDMRGGMDVETGQPAPLCACGLPCLSLTSRTAANMDRVFFKCPQSSESGRQCDFFEWADGEGSRSNAAMGGQGVLQPDKDFIAENKRMFGHNTFREGQRGCIEAALAGRDVFCLMPTGGGKSLVYQLPAWCCPGISVVFSPLISLIQDQVEALIAMGIRAAYFSASKNEAENAAVFDELYHISTGRDGGRVTDYYGDSGGGSQEGSIKLLYLTPEKYKNSPKMKNMLKRLYNNGKLSRFVIDEAHCLSEWGHDFRPDYISLTDLKSEFPDTPIMALTATANKTVADDCIRILRLQNPYRHTHSFNRPNISYSVKKKDKKVVEEIGAIISKRQSQTGIVYCFSKKDTEKVCEDLKKAIPSMKNKITFYHAEVPPHEKERRQHMWSQGNIKVICATIAFGMGINKPDVRYVIHYSMPKSLTNYYQESGRAGRDGGLSESIIFYSYADKQRLCSLAQKGNEDGGGFGRKAAAVDRALKNIAEVTSYCMNRLECRRSLVLRYFGENFDREKCRSTCDNCAEQGCWELCGYEEQGQVVVRVLQGLNALGGLKDLTLVQLKQLVTNSKDKKLERYRDGLEKRGIPVAVKHMVKGKNVVMTKDSCDVLLQTMVMNKYLTETSQATMAGFNAEYVNLGPEAHALEAGTGTLSLCLPMAGQQPSSNNLMLGGDQLSDEQFMMFDIDSVVAGTGGGSGNGSRAASGKGGMKQTGKSVGQSSRGQKRKGGSVAVARLGQGLAQEEMPGVGVLVRESKKIKSSSKQTYILSDTSSDEGEDLGHFSDIDDADAGSWSTSDIRSRNKGKARQGQGALSLKTRKIASAAHHDDDQSVVDVDLTEDHELQQRADTTEQGLSLTRKEKADLREWLYAFRKRYHNYWVVLNNNSVHDITEQIPLSRKDLESVSGLGENKIRLHGDLIIATTWAFLHSRGMLSRIPAMVKGNFLDSPPVKVLDCPSWRDPQSDEAHEIQQRTAEAQIKKTAPPATAATSSPHFSNVGTPSYNSYKPSQPKPQSTSYQHFPSPSPSTHAATPSSAKYSIATSEPTQQSPESPLLMAIENRNNVSIERPPKQQQSHIIATSHGLVEHVSNTKSPHSTLPANGASDYSVSGSRMFSDKYHK